MRIILDLLMWYLFERGLDTECRCRPLFYRVVVSVILVHINVDFL